MCLGVGGGVGLLAASRCAPRHFGSSPLAPPATLAAINRTHPILPIPTLPPYFNHLGAPQSVEQPSKMPPSSSSSSLSHSYTTLLSTLHERSSLLSTPSATIPPSLNRTLKKQIDTFARAIVDGSGSGGNVDLGDARMKWDRIEEALQGDEEGRKVLLAVRDR